MKQRKATTGTRARMLACDELSRVTGGGTDPVLDQHVDNPGQTPMKDSAIRP